MDNRFYKNKKMSNSNQAQRKDGYKERNMLNTEQRKSLWPYHCIVIFAAAVIIFFAWSADALDAKVVELNRSIASQDEYVPVDLARFANDNMHVELPATPAVQVNGIPFELISGVANNLFLKDAGWPEWELDPSDYYAQYDNNPDSPDCTLDRKKFSKKRYMASVPVDDYVSAYVLAVAEDDEAYSQILSLRIGTFQWRWRTAMTDFSISVPRMKEETKLPRISGGKLVMLEIPLGLAAAQEFQSCRMLDVDITKDLRLAIRKPDPCRYAMRPLGLLSGVHVFAITFKRANVRLELTGNEPGNVFNEPQVPVFTAKLTTSDARSNGDYTVETTVRDTHGNTKKYVTDVIQPKVDKPASVSIPIPVKERGYYELTFRLVLQRGKLPVVERKTTLAMLAPDTRKFRSDSPFGTWDFQGAHGTPRDPEMRGSLQVKAGMRYAMFGLDGPSFGEKYGLLPSNEIKNTPQGWKDYAKKVKESQDIPLIKRAMIFHETSISGSHIMRIPSFMMGGKQYQFNEKEKEKFDNLWKEAEESAAAIRKELPLTEIYFGNGNPMLAEEFLQRKFPADMLGSRGNESGNFMRSPEAQPPDWIGNNAGLFIDRSMLDHYGYNSTPLRQCYEMCYPCTSPGNLTLHTQADYAVRHMLHSLAWRIPIIRGFTLTDMGSSYYFSNWGAAGLCFAWPNVSPKPSYVAFATMTQVLDGMEFSRIVPTGSAVTYAMEFLPMKKNTMQKVVTCLWTASGKRSATLVTNEKKPVLLTEPMGNEVELTPQSGALQVELSESPVFITTGLPLDAVKLGAPVQPVRPKVKNFVISTLGTMSDWVVEQGRSKELELYNFLTPRRKGNFTYAETASFEGEKSVLSVKAVLPVEGSAYLPMYSILNLKKEVEIPGEPTEIGLMVNGNGGWARLIFELEDASGQRWISIGAEVKSGEPTAWMADQLSKQELQEIKGANMSDWNTDDTWGRSVVNFEGWKYLRFPLPGNYPGEKYHWPFTSQWRCQGGVPSTGSGQTHSTGSGQSGVVHYPLKFKKLIVTMPEKVLSLTEFKPVERPEIYLKDLMVTYEPVETAQTAK